MIASYILGIVTGIAMVLAFLAGQRQRLKRQLAQYRQTFSPILKEVVSWHIGGDADV